MNVGMTIIIPSEECACQVLPAHSYNDILNFRTHFVTVVAVKLHSLSSRSQCLSYRGNNGEINWLGLEPTKVTVKLRIFRVLRSNMNKFYIYENKM
jgi:hypothetical protein